MEMRKTESFLFFVTLLCLLCPTLPKLEESHNETVVDEVHVGVILDMVSWEGKIIQSCISMATSDFYSIHAHYKTRVVLHTRDSKGEPLRALSAALELLENTKVTTIIGAQTSLEANLLAELGDKAKVPVISFSALAPFPSSAKYPYFVEVTENEISQVKGIAAMVEAFNWRDAILIYEDTDYERDIVPYLFEFFHEKHIQVTYKSVIGASSGDDQIIEELHKIMALQTSVFVVHMSHSLASRLCLNAKSLGMMNEGYVWILTSRSMNFFHSMDPAVIDSMQGVIALKSHIPSSKRLENFTKRWRRKIHSWEPDMEVTELSPISLWAYDVAWGLAKAAEGVSLEIAFKKKPNSRLNLDNLHNFTTSEHGSIVLKEMLQTRFTGLSGDFQYIDGKLFSNAFEIVNVIGSVKRRVGYWTSAGRITRELYSPNNRRHLFSGSEIDLEAIIWPGGSVTTPKGYMLHTVGKKLTICVPWNLNMGFTEFVKVEHDLQTNTMAFTGFAIDVFKAAIKTLRYQGHCEFTPFQDTQGQPTVSYNDLIDQVYLQKCDAAAGDITITANRSLYVDFTIPYTDLGVGMVAPKQSDKTMWIFLKPLTTDLWLSSAGFFLLTGLVVWLIERPINDEFQGPLAQQIGTIFWFSFSTLVYAHRERLLSNLSRFVMIVWLFVVLILNSSYTATLTSMLTVQQFKLNSKDNSIGYHGGLMIIRNLNFENPSLKPLHSLEEYARALSAGSKNGGVSAIIDEVPYIKALLAKYPSRYSMIGSVNSTTNGFGFVFRKGSPLVHDMSRAIAKLREEGKLLELENAWFKNEPTFTIGNDTVANENSLTLESFRGLFLISGISSALALAIFSMLVLRDKWHVVKERFNFVKKFFKFVKKYISEKMFKRNEGTNVIHPK